MMLITILFSVNFLVIFAYKEECLVPIIPNGFVHELTIHDEFIHLEPGRSLMHGTEILVTCDDDFELSAHQLVEENFALKCNNGNYAFIPSCVPVTKSDDDNSYEIDMQPGRFPGRSGRMDSRGRLKKKAPCYFEPRDDILLGFFEGSPIEKNTSFQDGSNLIFRCFDISTYSLVGNKTRICENGKWKGKSPHCIRLYSYSFYSAPVITYDVTTKNFSILENGSLAIPQHTNVTIQCLWLRDNGDPHWKKDGKVISKDEIPSKIVWNAKENALGLFIPKIQLQASGYYLCQTPNRKKHGIEIIVIPTDDVEEIEEIVTDIEKDDLSCLYIPNPNSHTQIFLNGKGIRTEEQKFPNGIILAVICENVLEYRMEGNKIIQCKDGRWTSEWANCTQLTDDFDSPPPLDIQITGTDKSYFVDDRGMVIVPKDTTVSFLCKFSGGKPMMAIQGTKLRYTTGQHRYATTTAWYLRADIPTNSVHFTFQCKIPRKDITLAHSIEVVAKGTCKLEEKKLQYRWRGSRVLPTPGRFMYVEDELVSVECDETTTSVIPTHFRCGDKGNWIPGPNQRCRAMR